MSFPTAWRVVAAGVEHAVIRLAADHPDRREAFTAAANVLAANHRPTNRRSPP